jgi:lipopolysaccharide transport system ATP-binding protein
MPEPILSVRQLSKRYAIGQDRTVASFGRSLIMLLRQDGKNSQNRKSHIWALKDISFDVNDGERVGLIGRNGAGKTTMLKILSRVAYPTEGEARLRGRVTSLLEVGTGFINNLSGLENIYINASFHGLTRAEVDDRLEDIVEFSELRKFLKTPIKFYSSGMRARLAFSVAAHLDPDILLLDEVLSVGDMAFARKCLKRVEEMTRGDRTIMFVSHSMDAIRRFCSRCIWIENGKMVMDGPVQAVTDAYTRDTLKLHSHESWTTVSPPPERVSASEAARHARNGDANLPEPPHARLVSASIITPDGRETSTVCVSDEIGLEVVYDLLYEGIYVLPSFRIYTEEGTLAFSVIHAEATPENYRRSKGRYRSVAKIPPHLMSTGRHNVFVGLNTPSPGKLIRHHEAENALTFFVHEAPSGSVSALGPYIKVKGAVRPLIDWSDEKVEYGSS